MVQVGLIGLGTVGTGVAKIIKSQNLRINKLVGTEVALTKFCDTIATSKPEIGLNDGILKDYKEILADKSIDIVVELIGGYEPARTIILEAIRAGKHVVTANKAVLAKYLDEILMVAQKHERQIYFEAAVGGGIPVIQGLNEGLAANQIKKIIGILNGTTNFILTQMVEKNISFEQALKAAQKAGFAESDPSFDIEGTDTAHKLVILSSIAFGSWIKISDVYCEGISKLELYDLQVAQELGYGLKLLGIAKDSAGEIEVKVHPTLLPLKHPFISVRNEYNAISITGDAADDVMFYGKGAGMMAAASNVVADIIYLARQVAQGTAGKLPYIIYDPKDKVSILNHEKISSKYYLRFAMEDKPGVLAKIAGILGDSNVSIASVYQPKTIHPEKKGVPIILTTHLAEEGKVQKALQQINQLPITKSNAIFIRIEEDGR